MPKKRTAIDDRVADLIADAPAPPKRSAPVNAESSVTPTHRGDGSFAPGNPWSWKPGTSGNPGGRPVGTTEMKQQAQAATESAMTALVLAAEMEKLLLQWAVDVMANPKAHTIEEIKEARAIGTGTKQGQVAIKEILDRGHGKPQQNIALSDKDVLEEMSREELENYILSKGTVVTAAMAERRKAKNGK